MASFESGSVAFNAETFGEYVKALARLDRLDNNRAFSLLQVRVLVCGEGGGAVPASREDGVCGGGAGLSVSRQAGQQPCLLTAAGEGAGAWGGWWCSASMKGRMASAGAVGGRALVDRLDNNYLTAAGEGFMCGKSAGDERGRSACAMC